MTVAAIDILYVITDLERGGVPLHLHRLACAMKQSGLKPAVVSLAPPGPVGDMLEASGVAVHSCHARGGRDFRVIRRLTALMRDIQPTVVHAMLFHANFASRRAAHRAGLPPQRIICEIQTVEVERSWHLLVDRFTHHGCRCTIGNSPSVVEHLHTKARIPRKRLRLVRGGIDPARIQQATPIDITTLGLPPNTPLVLWVGRLDPVKGLTHLIDAFARLAPTTAAHLLLAGDGPLRDKLLRRIRQRNLCDRIHLLGARNDVPALLKAAHVFAFPSRTEGLPNAILEAMVARCPIVTTRVPGCRDLIEDGLTGRVVPYGDKRALASAMAGLLSDRPTAIALADHAAVAVERDWPIKRTYNAYLACYREIEPGW